MARARSYFIILFFFFRQRDGENKTIYLVTRSQTQHECWKGRRSLAVGEKIPGRATEYLQQRKRFFFFFCPSKSQYIISAGDTPSFQAFTMLDAFYRAEQEGERKTFLRPTCLEKPASELMDVTAGNGLVCVWHTHTRPEWAINMSVKKKKYFLFLF